jgi:methanogenic corrinoid protein MtbC1
MGRSISSVAALRPATATALLSEDLQSARPEAEPPRGAEAEERWIDDAYRHLAAMDTAALERILWRAFLALGARRFLEGVVAPLLSRVGTAWAAGRLSPAQEHLGSGVLERVLTWMNDPSRHDGSGPGVVIATLPGERHALGARLAAVAAQAEGWQTTYLGPDLPVDEIAAAARSVGAKTIAISAIQTDRAEETRAALSALRDLLDADVEILVGGAGARPLRSEPLPPGIEISENLSPFARPRPDSVDS